jgi:hypothetical protein
MRYLVRVCCVAILVLFAAVLGPAVIRAAAAEPAFGLIPVPADVNRSANQNYFIFDATPGQQVRDAVLVRNSGTAAGTVHLYVVDSTTGDNSGTAFPNEDVPRQAVGTWLQLAEHDLALAPGEERSVPFTVTIPADATSGQHLGGIVAANAAITQGTPTKGIQINTQTRVITAVQVNLPGAVVERVAVTGVTTGGREAEQTVVVGLRNEGTEMVQPRGTLSVTNAQGQEVQRFPLQLKTFLPGTAIQYPLAVQQQALGAGQYHAQVDLTYGTSGVTHYAGDFSITAAQVARVFPSAVALAPPPVAAPSGAPAAPPPITATTPAPWPLFAGGGALLGLLLMGGFFLGRRGRRGSIAK